MLQAAGQVAAAPLGQQRAPCWRQQGGQRQPPLGKALRQQQRGLHLRVAPYLLCDSRASASDLRMLLWQTSRTHALQCYDVQSQVWR